MSKTKRPYIICHMLPSIGGRIVLRNWKNGTREYERTTGSFGADGRIIGRVPMEPYAMASRARQSRSCRIGFTFSTIARRSTVDRDVT